MSTLYDVRRNPDGNFVAGVASNQHLVSSVGIDIMRDSVQVKVVPLVS